MKGERWIGGQGHIPNTREIHKQYRLRIGRHGIKGYGPQDKGERGKIRRFCSDFLFYILKAISILKSDIPAPRIEIIENTDYF